METVLDAPQVTPESFQSIPEKRPGKHLWTPEQARIASAKGKEALKRLREQRQAEADKVKHLTDLAPDEQYKLSQIARTREAVDKLWKDFFRCTDPKEQKAIADAIGRLQDVQFALAGWHKPGLTRPKAEKPKRTQGQSGPLDAGE